MAELTKEQIELAAEALWSATYNKRADPKEDQFRLVEEKYKEEWRVWARAAAPFLQIPWDEPNGDEVRIALIQIRETGLASEVLKNFIYHRNAALLPKPVDPRIAVVEDVIARGKMHLSADQKMLAAEILAALDEVKK